MNSRECKSVVGTQSKDEEALKMGFYCLIKGYNRDRGLEKMRFDYCMAEC